MKISIITASLNSGSTIEYAIQSVLAQTYPDIEYIVIDGNSSDNTSEVLKKYQPRIAKIVSEKDDGIYDAMNKGISHATGDVIGILHADDVYAHPAVIERIASVFKKENADGLYADLVYVRKNNLEKIVRYWKSGPPATELFLKGWIPPHPTFFAKRELFMKLGFYNTSFRFSADYELMLRFIYKCKIRISYLPEVTVKMRIGGVSNRKLLNRLKANYEDRLAWKVNNLKPGRFTFLQKPLSKLKQFFPA